MRAFGNLLRYRFFLVIQGNVSFKIKNFTRKGEFVETGKNKRFFDSAENFSKKGESARGGELLKQMADRGERRTEKDGLSDEVFHDERPPTFSDLGFTEAKADHWQLIALLPKKEREKYYKKEKKRAVNIRPFRLKALRKNLRN